MRSISNIPHKWTQEILKIREKFPGAVIAGGCLRDWTLYRENHIKDIDIFVPCSDLAGVQLLSELYPNQIIARKDLYGNFDNRDLSAIFSVNDNGTGLPIDIIFLNNDRILDRFDFGICQIMYDGESLMYTDQFVHDIINCRFTLVRADNSTQYKRSKRRFNRISSTKYQVYEFNPGEFGKYEI